jgi:hypothetical protein
MVLAVLMGITRDVSIVQRIISYDSVMPNSNPVMLKNFN